MIQTTESETLAMCTRSPNCTANHLAQPQRETSAQQPSSAFRGHQTFSSGQPRHETKSKKEKRLNDIIRKPTTIKAGAMTQCDLLSLVASRSGGQKRGSKPNSNNNNSNETNAEPPQPSQSGTETACGCADAGMGREDSQTDLSQVRNDSRVS